jgi:hypothetical protein
MADSDDDPPLGVPRWVKVFAVVATVLLAVFAILHITGVAPHGH